MSDNNKLPVVVLISGSGSNLQAIIDAAAVGLPIDVRAVISNQAEAFGMTRAKRAAIPAEVLDHRNYNEREQYDQALQTLIDSYQPKLVALAGFMRILTPQFVRHYAGHMFNIHPSLLPKFRGLHTHQRALDANERLHGASVHFVTEKLDGGPLIVQAQVPVLPGDNAEQLAERVLHREHKIYPLAIKWFAERRLLMNAQGKVVLDGEVLDQPVIFEPDQEIR